MAWYSFTKKKAALVGIPVAGVVVLGGAGLAYASTSTDNDRPTYTSSVRTTAKDDDAALVKLTKIKLADAARIGESAVPGSTAVEVELENEGGNVVWVVEVVGSGTEHEVVVDAGNGKVLDQKVDRDTVEGSDSRGGTEQKPAPSSATT